MDYTTIQNPLADIGRIHFLDHMRALALIAGILIHACFPYAYIIQDKWLLTDPTSSMSITYGFLFLHLFRMPLFYLIAGFFANYLYQKRGAMGFLKHRLKRIGLPFLIFLPLILIAANIMIFLVMFQVPEESMSPVARQIILPMKAQIELVRARKAGISDNTIGNDDTRGPAEDKSIEPGSAPELFENGKASAPDPDQVREINPAENSGAGQADPQITQHLWFLFYLLFFCLCAALLQRFNHPIITKIFDKIFSSPIYLWLIPLFMVPSLYHIDVPWQAPMHILPRLWPFGYFGIFFLFGWHLFYHQDYLDRIDKHLGLMVVVSILASAFYLYFTPGYYLNLSAVGADKESLAAMVFFRKMLLVVLEAYSGVFLTVISLIFGKRYLNFGNRYMRFISDSSYWIYIIHFPLVTCIQVFFVTAPFPGYYKLILSSAIMFCIGLVTYRYVVRYTFIGTMLNGKRVRGLA